MAITNRFASEEYVAEQNFLINEKLDVLSYIINQNLNDFNTQFSLLELIMY